MDDLEITRACAEAMGYEGFQPCTHGPFASGSMLTKRDGEQSVLYYDPLNNDAQCMTLMKRFRLFVNHSGDDPGYWKTAPHGEGVTDCDENLNAAVCKCVARMRSTKEQPK